MRMRNNRRIIRIMTILLLAIVFVLNTSLCERSAWDCPECGRTGNTGNYCGGCAHPAPSKEEFKTVGSIVTFGHYEQDNDLNNGAEEIEWIVLDYDEKENKSLLLSRYGLDVKSYHDKSAAITWKQCTLRKWLNNNFYNTAFNTEEQVSVLLTDVDNSPDGGDNTLDKVFLLSDAEANRYLNVTAGNRYNTKARVAPTAYSIALGAYTTNMETTAEGDKPGWWWLRSPGNNLLYADFVYGDGSLSCMSVCSAGSETNIVRPAFWLSLESDIF